MADRNYVDSGTFRQPPYSICIFVTLFEPRHSFAYVVAPLAVGVRGAISGGAGRTADELDAARQGNIAYEYLCHLEEARK